MFLWEKYVPFPLFSVSVVEIRLSSLRFCVSAGFCFGGLKEKVQLDLLLHPPAFLLNPSHGVYCYTHDGILSSDPIMRLFNCDKNYRSGSKGGGAKFWANDKR